MTEQNLVDLVGVSSDLVIKSISNNNDILLKGVDGSSTITLQLDMSEGGDYL